jgi:aspartyl-tRNA(Asn)/glutamyl-tRNA(Gln) amidotransferase subunit C
MALTTDSVRKIATLARLHLSPEEEVLFAGQLGKIVDYIDQLQEYAPGEEISAPSLSPLEARREAREAMDEVHPCLPRELFLANAPAALDGFLLVPEVKGTEDAG